MAPYAELTQEPYPAKGAGVAGILLPMPVQAHTRDSLEVLIVEDNHDVRTTLRMLLTMGHGHVVHEAADGASGVRLALELRPDVALVDLGLPDLAGHEVARRIRAVLDRSEILLIALTGYGSAEDQRLAQEAGFDIHLLKPVEFARLAGIFDDLVRSRERAKAAGLTGKELKT